MRKDIYPSVFGDDNSEIPESLLLLAIFNLGLLTTNHILDIKHILVHTPVMSRTTMKFNNA